MDIARDSVFETDHVEIDQQADAVIPEIDGGVNNLAAYVVDRNVDSQTVIASRVLVMAVGDALRDSAPSAPPRQKFIRSNTRRPTLRMCGRPSSVHTPGSKALILSPVAPRIPRR